VSISIRKLEESEWQTLADIRLRALKSDPSVFGSNYAAEAQRTESDWRQRLNNDDSAIFVVFDGDRPVGMTAISVDRDDPAKKTAMLWGSWLEPDCRRKGISEIMYRARIEWAREHPTVERVIVSHRESNVASKFANQKHGFVFSRMHSKVWHDGVTENEVFYGLLVK